MANRLCCVKDCNNSAYHLVKWKQKHCDTHNCNFGTSRCICDPPFVLFPFPTERQDSKTRSVWIKNVNRASSANKIWTPNYDSRICSKHFIDGYPSILNPYPTLQLGHDGAIVEKARPPPLDRSKVIPTPPKKRKSVSSEDKLDDTDYTCIDPHVTTTCHDHQYASNCSNCVKKDKEIQDLKLQILKLKSELNIEKAKNKVNIKSENIFKSDKKKLNFTQVFLQFVLSMPYVK